MDHGGLRWIIVDNSLIIIKNVIAFPTVFDRVLK